MPNFNQPSQKIQLVSAIEGICQLKVEGSQKNFNVDCNASNTGLQIREKLLSYPSNVREELAEAADALLEPHIQTTKKEQQMQNSLQAMFTHFDALLLATQASTPAEQAGEIEKYCFQSRKVGVADLIQ